MNDLVILGSEFDSTQVRGMEGTVFIEAKFDTIIRKGGVGGKDREGDSNSGFIGDDLMGAPVGVCLQ